MKSSFVYHLHNKQNLDAVKPKQSTKSMNFGQMIKLKAQLLGYESPPLKQSLRINRRYSQLENHDTFQDSSLKYSQIISFNDDSISKNKMVRFEDEESEGQTSRMICQCGGNLKKKPSILKKATSIDKVSVNSGTSDMGQIDSLNAKSSLRDKGIACSNDKYKKELKMLKYENIKFFDKIFPPGGSSLCYSKPKIQQFKSIKWVRIYDLFKGKKQVLYNSHPSSKCIYQAGPLGYGINFASACNSFSNSNRCIERIFQEQKVLGLCIYYLRINHDGIWKYVIIDDFIPTVLENNQEIPAFMRICQNQKGEIEIWPLLIQKALAKIYNSYESLFEESVENILYDLTGFPPESLNLQSQEPQYKFRSSVTHSQAVSFVTDPFNSDYFSSDCYPIRQDGSMLSSTFFSFDPKYKLFNLKNNENIIFDLSDLKKQFKTAKLYPINDTYYSLGCLIKQNLNSISLRKFVIRERSANCIISLIQKDKKYYQNNGYDYVWARIMVVSIDGTNGYRWIAGKYEKRKCLALHLNLDPGDYFVVVNGDWKKKAFEMTLNYQGNQEIQFERKTLEQHPNILTQTCMDLAQRFGLFRQLNKNLCSYSIVDRNNGFIIQNVNNQVNRFIVFHKQYCLKGNNYQLLDKEKYTQEDQSNFVQIKIKPNSNFTFIAKMINGIDQELVNAFHFD